MVALRTAGEIFSTRDPGKIRYPYFLKKGNYKNILSKMANQSGRRYLQHMYLTTDSPGTHKVLLQTYMKNTQPNTKMGKRFD